MTELLSHYKPDICLSQHVSEVRTAADYILATHSAPVADKRPDTREILATLVSCHDMGKASRAFQEYIRDPFNYKGDLRAKAHANISAALGLLWAKARGWDPLHALVLAQVVAGHHSGFQPLDYLKNARLCPDDDGLMEDQWDTLDFRRIGKAVGLDISEISGDFDDGGRWLFRRSEVEDKLNELGKFEAVCFRMWTQFLFSIILEADKAFLALREEEAKHYLSSLRPDLDPAMIDQFISALPSTPVDKIRQQARRQVLDNMSVRQLCTTITLPTGTGKTLIAANWAMTLRQKMAEISKGIPPKIIIVLPYLSIIDQTEKVYRELLRYDTDNASSTELLMASHSLSERSYELDGDSPGQKHTEFFLDTWRSEIVITTFDQLLLALFSSRTRHLMRFHPLTDAIIVLDEVQTLPCQLWDPVDNVLRALTHEGNSRVLMMSATQPAMLQGASELVGNKDDVSSIFKEFRRYQIIFQHRDALPLDDFIAKLETRSEDWIRKKLRVLITLNTRASARMVWDVLSENLEDQQVTVHLISADVTPLDRLEKIKEIKKGGPCVVVSTQTIEAGVDIDMNLVIRDFAPFDALIQISGRCNRSNHMGTHGGRVEVVSLKSSRGRAYADMIYDSVLLSVTHEILDNCEEVGEEDILEMSRRYFSLLNERKNTGEKITNAFARWEEMPDIHTLLRGERLNQVSFLVRCDSDADKWITQLENALETGDRWERRSKLRRLAGHLHKRSVTVYARSNLYPEDYAESIGPFWILKEGYYSSERGFDLRLDEEDSICIF